MPGLRDILEAATREGVYDEESVVWLKDHAPELAALALDMGEALNEFYGTLSDGLPCHCDETCGRCANAQALLARLDQLGKEQT